MTEYPTIAYNEDISPPRVMQLMPNLRWIKCKSRRDNFISLQQAWGNPNSGEIEWRTIPEVELSIEEYNEAYK